MPCRIYKLDFQEKNLYQEIHGSNPAPGSNFPLENLISKWYPATLIHYSYGRIKTKQIFKKYASKNNLEIFSELQL